MKMKTIGLLLFGLLILNGCMVVPLWDGGGDRAPVMQQGDSGGDYHHED